MQPEAFINLPDDDQSMLWDTLKEDEKKAVLAYGNTLCEIEYDAELLANGIEPDEVAPRRKAIDDLCSAAGRLGDGGPADQLFAAVQRELEGHGVGEQPEALLARFRESVQAFEVALGRAQVFSAAQ